MEHPTLADLIHETTTRHGFVRPDGSFIWTKPTAGMEGATPTNDERKPVVGGEPYDLGSG